ncbi:MAG: hypothetical protein SPJ89_08925 [Treponema sp.]|nr:hypothetical protein [Spirochaetales bacterium]MDY5812087.1 hypothetical protein [Treponema sp.]
MKQVIFITEHDVLKNAKPLYHIDRTIKETGRGEKRLITFAILV